MSKDNVTLISSNKDQNSNIYKEEVFGIRVDVLEAVASISDTYNRSISIANGGKELRITIPGEESKVDDVYGVIEIPST